MSDERDGTAAAVRARSGIRTRVCMLAVVCMPARGRRRWEGRRRAERQISRGRGARVYEVHRGYMQRGVRGRDGRFARHKHANILFPPRWCCTKETNAHDVAVGKLNHILLSVGVTPLLSLWYFALECGVTL